ncbi:MAG: translation initiation factor [Planctomycetota bacterium]
MTRREPKPTPEPAPHEGGLKHNPFAALRAKQADLPPASTNDGVCGAESDERATNSPTATRARVTVRRERVGRGGKTVTIVEGPGIAGRDVEALARDIARALGTGARAEAGALVVQGDQSDRLVAWLGARGFSNVTRGN